MRNSYNNETRPNWQHEYERRTESNLPPTIPPLGRWTREWLNDPRDEFVNFAIQDAERNLSIWTEAAKTKGGFAILNKDLAQCRLDDITEWQRRRKEAIMEDLRGKPVNEFREDLE